VVPETHRYRRHWDRPERQRRAGRALQPYADLQSALAARLRDGFVDLSNGIRPH
jgi:hypothetical protein